MSLIRHRGLAIGAIMIVGLTGVLRSAAADNAPISIGRDAPAAPASAATPDDHKKMLMQYCTACHNDRLKIAGMSVVPLDANVPSEPAFT